MPELPEVETVVRQLRPELVGRRVAGGRVLWPKTVGHLGPAAFLAGVRGRRIDAVRRRGKFFVLDLSGGRHVVGHLRMTGRLHVVPADQAHQPFVRLRLSLDDGRTLLFCDVRKFGRLLLVDDPDDVLGALGPEPLDRAFTARWMAAALAARRRLLKPLLLDQTFVAGLGNIYVDESLHRAGLHPLQRATDVAPERAADLVRAIRTVLRRAVAAEGSSFDAFYRTPEGKPGGFQDEFSVYGRQGLPCRRCGTSIVRLVVGQRGTWLCPVCQPAPRRRRVVRRVHGPGSRRGRQGSGGPAVARRSAAP